MKNLKKYKLFKENIDLGKSINFSVFENKLIDKGFKRIDKFSHEKNIANLQGVIFERDNTFIGITTGQSLGTNKYGHVIIFNTFRNDLIINSIYSIDEGKGNATKAINDIIDICKELHTNIYIEPTPIIWDRTLNGPERYQMSKRLMEFYKKFGFIQQDEKVMILKNR